MNSWLKIYNTLKFYFSDSAVSELKTITNEIQKILDDELDEMGDNSYGEAQRDKL